VQDFSINYADDVGAFGFDVLDIDDGDDIFDDEDNDEQEVIRVLDIG
jgi:hypothetical protein